ncbi:carbohydrate kinase family protein [Rhodococcus sp. HNM0569]|uniref:carbohydrate kinase family protein n=1 Tax=Rhodococcus sp. HNM0569 TaxID=2716340 RepID=UPI00146A0AB2|nr:carbohydrate kinase family protein [Rhodococcus sp. HNM0569]NLU85082.1 carbohydrate kinase family protein [Rhodococcus sp. HNM0569]
MPSTPAADGPVLAFGVHILDTLVRPVESIPEGQSAALVEAITVTAAGTAGAAGLVMSRLGADVRSAGVVGDDSAGDFLVHLLGKEGVDTSRLVRADGTATSASVLPIRPDGSRPAFHVLGATALLPQHVPWDDLDGLGALHLGGPEFFGGDLAAQICSRARRGGAITSADSLAPPDAGSFEWFAAVLPHLDFLLPNDEQVLGWTGASDLEEGCRVLVERGAGAVVATAGADPTVVATVDGTWRVPVFDVDVVDTTGCGDAFSGGFVRAIQLGKTVTEAALFGNAVAAQVAQGLGSDYGDYDADSIARFVAERAAR